MSRGCADARSRWHNTISADTEALNSTPVSVLMLPDWFWSRSVGGKSSIRQPNTAGAGVALGGKEELRGVG